jgi:hypothetical protein
VKRRGHANAGRRSMNIEEELETDFEELRNSAILKHGGR